MNGITDKDIRSAVTKANAHPRMEVEIGGDNNYNVWHSDDKGVYSFGLYDGDTLICDYESPSRSDALTEFENLCIERFKHPTITALDNFVRSINVRDTETKSADLYPGYKAKYLYEPNTGKHGLAIDYIKDNGKRGILLHTDVTLASCHVELGKKLLKSRTLDLKDIWGDFDTAWMGK